MYYVLYTLCILSQGDREFVYDVLYVLYVFFVLLYFVLCNPEVNTWSGLGSGLGLGLGFYLYIFSGDFLYIVLYVYCILLYVYCSIV